MRRLALIAALVIGASAQAQIRPCQNNVSGFDGGKRCTANPLPSSQGCLVVSIGGLVDSIDGGSLTATLTPVDPLSPSNPAGPTQTETFTGPVSGAELCAANGSGAWSATMQMAGAGAYATNVTTSIVGTTAPGPTGPVGPTGAACLVDAGLVGPTGPTGATGSAGATGAQGPQGVAGANGSNGATGATGPSTYSATGCPGGIPGYTGPNGETCCYTPGGGYTCTAVDGGVIVMQIDTGPSLLIGPDGVIVNGDGGSTPGHTGGFNVGLPYPLPPMNSQAIYANDSIRAGHHFTAGMLQTNAAVVNGGDTRNPVSLQAEGLIDGGDPNINVCLAPYSSGDGGGAIVFGFGNCVDTGLLEFRYEAAGYDSITAGIPGVTPWSILINPSYLDLQGQLYMSMRGGDELLTLTDAGADSSGPVTAPELIASLPFGGGVTKAIDVLTDGGEKFSVNSAGDVATAGALSTANGAFTVDTSGNIKANGIGGGGTGILVNDHIDTTNYSGSTTVTDAGSTPCFGTTGSSLALSTGSNDSSGVIVFTAGSGGTSACLGPIVTVTLARAFQPATFHSIVLTAEDVGGNTPLNVAVKKVSESVFQVSVQTSATPTTNWIYAFDYSITGLGSASQ